MKKIYQYIRKGKVHEQKNMACQDVVCSMEKDSIQVITLADGAGDTDYGRMGAEVTAKTLADFLTNCFDELYESEKKDVQYNIIIKIRKELYKKCDRYRIDLEDLKSTAIGVAVDTKDNRVLMVHLGDGYIIMKSADEYHIVSYPNNSGNRCQTCLTSTIPVCDDIKVYCGKIKNIQQVFLMSDGWCEFINKDEDILKILLSNTRLEFDQKGQDDLSFICLNMEEKNE